MDEHEHKDPIILTSPGRMTRGILIVGITLAICAAILIVFFDEMVANPPPVTQIRQPEQPGEEPPPAQEGTTTISIPSGASVQGNPDYEPDNAEVPLGNKVVWTNDDTVPHTATSGTGPEDPNNAQIFDTGLINGGESSDPVELADVAEGDVIDYYCFVHPYMVGKITVTAAGEAAAPAGGAAGGGDADSSPAAATITIPQGASVQGNPAYDPAEITVKVGDEVSVVNEDTVPHTVTSGTAPDDPNSAKFFDTGLLDGGASGEIALTNIEPGNYDYYCFVHPYMKGKMIIE